MEQSRGIVTLAPRVEATRREIGSSLYASALIEVVTSIHMHVVASDIMWTFPSLLLEEK